MIWMPFKLHDQFQYVYFNFDVWRRCKFNIQIHVLRRNIIGHFGPIPLNKWFSSTPKMHNSFILNPNEVKLVTNLKDFERDTTLMKDLLSFEVHRKSYSSWKKWTHGLILRFFFICLIFQTSTSKFITIQASNEKVLNMKVVPLNLTFSKSSRSSHLAKKWRTCKWVFLKGPFG